MPPAKPPFKSALGPLAAALAASLAGAILLAPRASAADLDPMYADSPQIQQQQMVTFGSGWYVRGDIAATDGLDVTAGDEPFKSKYVGPGQTPPSLLSSSSHHLAYDADIGAGYQFTPYFRTDAVFDYDQPVTASHSGASHECVTGDYAIPGTQTSTLAGIVTGPTTYKPTYTTCTPTLTAHLTSYDVLLNGYVDLGTWYGVTPYIGAGVGAAFGTATASSQYIQGNDVPYNVTYTSALNGSTYNQFWDRSQSKSYTNFAYAFMAGFGYALYPHVILDVGYRYVNLGSVLGTKLATQQAHVGVRYMIDN